MPKIIETFMKGLFVIELDVYKDERGFFAELFNKEELEKLGITNNFVQDNYSSSKPNVIRGLHFQQNPNQSKLVSCVKGRILDVAVDIRKNSKTYGQHFSIELSEDNGKLLFIPYGFAHGFCVLGEESANILYKIDAFYSKEGEGGIRFDDEDLNIKWPISNPLLSEKDQTLPPLKKVLFS